MLLLYSQSMSSITTSYTPTYIFLTEQATIIFMIIQSDNSSKLGPCDDPYLTT